MKLYVDMDGVLADFDKLHRHRFGKPRERHTGWGHVIEQYPDFFKDIPPMEDMPDLWHAISHLNPTVLTGIPSSVSAAANDKRVWVAENLGIHVPVICCRAKEKFKHAKPGDVLIDDSAEYRPLWESAGGRWVQHDHAADTITQLKKLGVI